MFFSGYKVISPLPAQGADSAPRDHQSFHQSMSFPDGPLDTQSQSLPSPCQTKHPARCCNRPGIDTARPQAAVWQHRTEPQATLNTTSQQIKLQPQKLWGEKYVNWFIYLWSYIMKSLRLQCFFVRQVIKLPRWQIQEQTAGGVLSYITWWWI